VIPGLAHGTDIDQDFAGFRELDTAFAMPDGELVGAVGLPDHRVVGVSAKANGLCLRLEVNGCVFGAQHVPPFFRGVEGAVDKFATVFGQRQRQLRQPLALLGRQVLARKCDARDGGGVHFLKIDFLGSGSVVVALEHGAVQGANFFHTPSGVRAVSDEVAQADSVANPQPIHVGKHRFQRFQVRVYVAKDRHRR